MRAGRMNEEKLREFLLKIQEKSMDVEAGVRELKQLPFADLGFAKIDFHRELRCGFPEVVYCQGKTVEQVTLIIRKLAGRTDGNILATRAGREIYEALAAEIAGCEYHELARLMVVRRGRQEQKSRIL